MYYNRTYINPMSSSSYGTDFTQEAFEKALNLMREAVQDERNDELLYDYLIGVAPTGEEKSVITSIRDDERSHRQRFREIYRAYTGEELMSGEDTEFVKPASYLEAVRKAVFGELGAMEKYRFIREGLPSRHYRDVVFRILTDEMKHATKYNYILTQNQSLPQERRTNGVTPAGGSFTKEQAATIASELGIDFTKSKFDLNQFWMGVNTELEHGRKYYPTNVTSDNPISTGKIALAHLNEFPDYYTRLKALEEQAKAFWGK